MSQDSMSRHLAALVCFLVVGFCGACGGSSNSPAPGVVINVQGAFSVVEAGASPITLMAMVTGSGNQGVKWTLSQANTNCAPACGMLSGSTSTSIVYTPPAAAPTNQQATITATSLADGRQNYVFNFQITPPVSVSIAPKFTTQTAGGPVVDLTATVTDITNSGVTWTLLAGGVSCSPQCGVLTVDPAPALTAEYQPPATVPTGASDSPTITATSNLDSSKSDSISFTIVAPPISVTITNKFSTETLGGAAVTVNAVVTNDPANAGVTWTLTSTSGACSPDCGSLVPSAAPSFSAVYTPPASAPTVAADVSPTITATSVTSTTQSDSFAFSIVNALALFKGSYAFQVRGFDSAGLPMALSGSVASDGAGNISGGELDLNDNTVVTSATGLTGTYVTDTSFNNILRLTINITAGANTVTLKGVLSSDGMHGRIIEYDSSLRLNAGTLLLQDATALSTANPAGSYVFGLDSDAGVSTAGAVTTTGRIVEAGQFTLGTGGASVTGGIADAGQAGAPAALFGGVTAAIIAAGQATAPDANGRGTLTLTINGNATNYAYYVVNANQLNLIEIDAGGAFVTVQSGSAQLQKVLDASSINGTSVAAITGSSGGTTSTKVIIGVQTVSGGTAVSANYENNAAGSVPPNQSPITGTGSVFSFDPTTGRAVILQSFFFGAAVYLSDSGTGYLMDISRGTDPNGGNNGFSGQLIPQVSGPFTVQGDIAGNSIGVTGGSASPALPNLDFAITFDSSGGYNSELDFTNQNLAVGTNGQVASAVRGGAYVLADTNLGRGTVSFAPAIFGDFTASEAVYGSFYIIGPHQFVMIGQGPTGTGVDPSGILYFDPQ
jgi:hypothetical protein